jgi:hypothetical protein
MHLHVNLHLNNHDLFSLHSSLYSYKRGRRMRERIRMWLIIILLDLLINVSMKYNVCNSNSIGYRRCIILDGFTKKKKKYSIIIKNKYSSNSVLASKSELIFKVENCQGFTRSLVLVRLGNVGF